MACDESLYRQYLNGDDEGLNALMKKYGDPLTLYIDGYLHDVHEAEELMLDVFAYLFTKKPKIRDGGFKAYLYKAARHMALRHKSKRKPLFSLDALTGEPDGRLLAEEVIRTEERNRVLHCCMSEINPDYREVLYLTYFEDMSYAQAAEVTGKTVKQITIHGVSRKKEPAKALRTGGDHRCGVMKSASRRQSGASPKLSGRNGGKHLSRRRCLGIHRHRAAGFFTRRVRDRSVFPAASDEPRGRAGQGKRGCAWS